MTVKEKIETRKLSQPELYTMVIEIPVQARELRIGLVNIDPRAEGRIEITDTDSERMRIVSTQTAEAWSEKLPESEGYIRSTEANIPTALGYLRAAQQKRYDIDHGTIVFRYWGNTSNPDELSGNDTYADIREGKLELVVGEEVAPDTESKLREWISDYRA